MKTLRIIGIVLLVIIILLLVISLFLPDKFIIERSVTIKAPMETVFEQVNCYKNWEKWSPWHKMDTTMKIKYSGSSSGTGCTFEWKSNNPKVGEGKMTIINSIPFDSIINEMDFMENGKALSKFIFIKEDSGIKVTWKLEQVRRNNPIEKIMGAVMKKMVGNHFERGLKELKDFCEKIPVEPMYKVEEIKINKQLYISISQQCSMKGIKAVIGKIYTDLAKFMEDKGIKCMGAPFSIYHGNPGDTVFIMEAGFPVDKKTGTAGNIKFGEIKEGNVLTTLHVGPYSGIAQAYEAIMKYIQVNNKKITGSPWEAYLNDPMVVKDSTKFETRVYFPVE